MNVDSVFVGAVEVADFDLSKVWGEAFADPRTPSGWNGRLSAAQALALAQRAYQLGLYDLAKAATAGALIQRGNGKVWAWATPEQASAARRDALAADVSAFLGIKGVN